MHRLWYFLILFGSVILQQLFLVPLSDYILGEPLLPIILVIILATATGSPLAEGMGFFTGVIWGLTKIDTGLPQGLYPLLLTIIAFVMGRLFHDRLKAARGLLLIILTPLAILFWGLGSIALKVIFIDSYLPEAIEFVQIVLSAFYSALLCFIISPLMRNLLARWERHGSV